MGAMTAIPALLDRGWMLDDARPDCAVPDCECDSPGLTCLIHGSDQDHPKRVDA